MHRRLTLTIRPDLLCPYRRKTKFNVDQAQAGTAKTELFALMERMPEFVEYHC